MEKIVSSEIYDEFRIEAGLIVKVSKYKISKKEYATSIFNSRKYKKSIKGCNRIYQVKEDITLDDGTLIEKNSYIYKFWSDKIQIVDVATDKNDFYIEITSTGGAIEGLGNKSIEKLEKIKSVLKGNYDLTL